MTPNKPNNASREANTRLFNNRLTPKDKRPASPCPICLLPGHTPDQGELREYTCTRGHEWLATKKQAEAHGTWLGRFANTPDSRNP